MACVSAVSGFREDGSEDEKEVLEIEVNEVLWRRLKSEERREGSTLPQAGERKKEDAPGKTGERKEDAPVKTLYSSPASRSTMRR